ncbi:MAG: hypothetical protein FJ387_17805 [Verrucomicrobia bacterium]|nr:hypothetical protein [Verrucomicrobiota bacterium]
MTPSAPIRFRSVILVVWSTLGLLATAGPACAGEETNRRWRPVPDEVYLQEIGQQVATDQPVTAVAVFGESVYAVVGGAVRVLRDGMLREVPDAPSGVGRLRSLGGALWAGAERGTYRFAGDGWSRVAEERLVDFCLHLGQVHAVTRNDVCRWDGRQFVNLRPADGYGSSDTTVIMEDGRQILTDPVSIGPVERLASYSGTLYLLRTGGLALLEGRVLVVDPVDWGRWPSPVTRDLLAQGSRLLVATDRGVAVLRGMALTALRGPDGLPYEDTTCLAEGFASDLWIGTTRGAIQKTGEDFHYFGGRRWLPDDAVRDIAVGEQAVYLATAGGLGIIRYEPYTLAKKAAYFQRELEDWQFQRLGFVHKLYRAGAGNGWWREVSDNDGGHTAHYLAAMSFRYAATRDDQARREALEAFKAMVWLDDITPKPGFIARSIWSVQGDPGQRARHGSGGLPAKWYPTRDGLWIWKGDTSSDEVNGHMYAVCLFYELAARGKEKERAAQHLANITSHIIDNGWVLRDMDGQPTRWGRWDPAYLLRPYGFEARGLNGMEAQTYVHTAFALTGDPKYQAGLEQLLQWRYHTYTVRQKLTFPPESVVPWDDELAFRCYHPLLRYARDAELRSIYLRSLERHWEVMRMQHVPFFNFGYGALTGNDCDAEQAVQHLRDWPLDLVNHSYRNSHRADLDPRPGYVPYQGGTRALSPRETGPEWGSRSALVYDGGTGGQTVTPPIGWLEDYWMGRYYGLIQAPTTQDPDLTAPPPRTDRPRGAAAYAGPPRPPAPWEH